MNYYILRKQKIWGRYEYDTDNKANRGYSDLGEVSKKLVALENLNENENISYVVVNDGTPIKQGLTTSGICDNIPDITERKICFI